MRSVQQIFLIVKSIEYPIIFVRSLIYFLFLFEFLAQLVLLMVLYCRFAHMHYNMIFIYLICELVQHILSYFSPV